MDNFYKALDFLRIPNPFRDVITLVGGFASLLFFQFSLKIDFLTLLRIGQLGRIEADFVILVISFVWGKLLQLLSNLVFDLINFLFIFIESAFLNVQPYKHRWIIFKQNWRHPNWKIRIAEFLNPKEFRRPLSPSDVKNEINILEVSDAVAKHPNITSETERSIYNAIFLRITLSASLIAGIFISRYYLLSSLIFLYLIISLNREINYREHKIFRAIVKEKGQEKSSQ